MLLNFWFLTDVLHHVGRELHSLCEVLGQALVFFVLDIGLDIQEAVHHCQEGSFPHQIVSIWKTAEQNATPPRAMIHLFCYVSGLHHRASRVLGVCEGYESVGDVSED